MLAARRDDDDVAILKTLKRRENERVEPNRITNVKNQYLKPIKLLGCPRDVIIRTMDCGIVVSEFVLQSR